MLEVLGVFFPEYFLMIVQSSLFFIKKYYCLSAVLHLFTITITLVVAQKAFKTGSRIFIFEGKCPNDAYIDLFSNLCVLSFWFNKFLTALLYGWMFLHAKTWHDQRLASLQHLNLNMLESSISQQRKATSSKQTNKIEGTVMSFLSDTLLTVDIQEQKAWFETECSPSLFSERKSICPCPLQIVLRSIWNVIHCEVQFTFAAFLTFSPTCSYFSHLFLVIGLHD